MKIQRPKMGKVIVGSTGLGVPDAEMLHQRAIELARIEGREEPDARDWEAAQRELHGEAFSELEGEEAKGEESRVHGGDAGEVQEEPLQGDERSTGEELVREGLEEAEHERMWLGQTAGEGREISGEEAIEECGSVGVWESMKGGARPEGGQERLGFPRQV